MPVLPRIIHFCFGEAKWRQMLAKVLYHIPYLSPNFSLPYPVASWTYWQSMEWYELAFFFQKNKLHKTNLMIEWRCCCRLPLHHASSGSSARCSTVRLRWLALQIGHPLLPAAVPSHEAQQQIGLLPRWEARRGHHLHCQASLKCVGGVLGTTANWSDGPCIDAIVLEASIEKTKKTRETSPANNPVPVTSNSSSSRLSRRRQNDRSVQGRPATKENAIFCLLNLNSQRLLDIDFSNRIHYCTICDNLVHSICLVDGVPVQIFTGICTSFPGSACLPYFNCPCSTAASWCLSQPCILDSRSQSFLPKEWITLNYFTCIAKRTEVVGFCRCFGYDCVNIDESSSGIRFILQ